MPEISSLMKIKGQGPSGDLLIKTVNHLRQRCHRNLA